MFVCCSIKSVQENQLCVLVDGVPGRVHVTELVDAIEKQVSRVNNGRRQQWPPPASHCSQYAGSILANNFPANFASVYISQKRECINFVLSRGRQRCPAFTLLYIEICNQVIVSSCRLTVPFAG